MLVPYIALVFLLLHFEVEASSGDKLEKKLDAVESNYAKLSEAYEKLVKAIVVCVKQTMSLLWFIKQIRQFLRVVYIQPAAN